MQTRPAEPDERLQRLRNSTKDCPVIWKGEYCYFIHPLTDGVPRQSASLLEDARDLVLEMVNWDEVDIILGIEAMGLPLASTLSLSTGKPLVIARKRAYGLPGEIAVDQETGYSKGTIYLNDIHEGERVFVVDDVVSTVGTLEALLQAVEWAGATVADVVVVFEKNEGMQYLLKRYDLPIRSLMRVEMDGEKVVLLD